MVKENLGTRVRRFFAESFQDKEEDAPEPAAKKNPLDDPRIESVTETPTKIFIKLKPFGTTGTESYGGYPREEYLDELVGRRKANVYDRMWRSDAQAQMLYAAVVNIIKGATWEIEGSPDKEGDPLTPDQEKDRDLIHQILFKDIENPFSKFLTDAMTVVRNGHAYLEKTYRLITDNGNIGPYHGISELALISAKTIERFNLSKDKRSKLASISQVASGDLQSMVDIPAEYLVKIILNQEGSNFEGVSMFRPIYGNFFRKNFYLKMNAIGIEKHAVPAPLVTIPQGFQETPEFQLLLDALEVYCSGQSNYLIKPEGVEIEFNNNAYDPEKVDKAVDGEDRRAAKAFLANFLELGMTVGGSQSLSVDQSDFFLAGLKAIANVVCSGVNVDLIPELIKINRGPRSTYPQLTVSGIDDKAGEELARILGILIDKKVIVPDDPLENSMRKRFGFTKKSAEGVREITPPNPFGMPPGGAPGKEGGGNILPPGKPGAPPPKEDDEEEGDDEPAPKDKKPKNLTERILARVYG